MNFEDKTYQRIEDYLQGSLSAEQKEAFLSEMESDPRLAAKVRAHELADDLVIERKLLDVKDIFREEVKKDGRKKLLRKGLAAGAGIALAVVLFSLFSGQEDVKQTPQGPAPADTQANSGKKAPAEKRRVSQVYETPAPAPVKQNPEPVSKHELAEKALIDTVSLTPLTAENTSDEPEKAVIGTEENEEQTGTEKTNNSVPDPAPVNPCEKAGITASVNATPTCEGEAGGVIRVTGISGGTAPYRVTINSADGSISSGNDLEAGTYTAEITDKNGCRKTYSGIKVQDKACLKEYSFNPFIGETFEIPTHEAEGTFTVYDNGGGTLYSRTVPGGSKETWDGRSLTGEQKTGYFMFEIRYSDGTSKLGYITIVR